MVLAALRSETALSRVEAANLQKVFALNAFGPILVSKVGHTLDPKPSTLVYSVRYMLT